jgi:hypothetical protein
VKTPQGTHSLRDHQNANRAANCTSRIDLNTEVMLATVVVVDKFSAGFA